MIFNFSVNQDKISINSVNTAMFSGNVNYYRCSFCFSEDWNGLNKFAVFIKGDNNYVVKIIDNTCSVPAELLDSSAYVSIGVYASNGQDNDYLRISSNMVSIYIDVGAYRDGTEPQPPTPDIWEQYIEQMQEAIDNGYAKIAANGNWLLWDAEKQEYTDSGLPSRGEKGEPGERGAQGEKGDTGEAGYTPVKGVDYWTDSDKAEISETISEEVAEKTASKADKTELASLKNELDKEIAAKQEKLTFDDTPTEGSENPVKSGGIFAALDGKADIKIPTNGGVTSVDGGTVFASIYNIGGGDMISLYFQSKTDGTSDSVEVATYALLQALLSDRLSITGGSITGDLTIAPPNHITAQAAPANDNHLVNKGYIDGELDEKRNKMDGEVITGILRQDYEGSDPSLGFTNTIQTTGSSDSDPLTTAEVTRKLHERTIAYIDGELLEYVKKTDVAVQNSGVPGLVNLGSNSNGIYISNNELKVYGVSKQNIDAKVSSTMPVCPRQIDNAAKASTHQEMSDEYDVSTFFTSAEYKEDKGNLPVSYNAVKGYVDGMVGDIETALDGIIALQESYIGNSGGSGGEIS